MLFIGWCFSYEERQWCCFEESEKRLDTFYHKRILFLSMVIWKNTFWLEHYEWNCCEALIYIFITKLEHWIESRKLWNNIINILWWLLELPLFRQVDKLLPMGQMTLSQRCFIRRSQCIWCACGLRLTSSHIIFECHFQHTVDILIKAVRTIHVHHVHVLHGPV